MAELGIKCLDGPEGCEGTVEYRMALSATGRSFPRCEKHWAKRVEVQEGITERYPMFAPSDFDPMDAGESWEEE